MKDDCLFCKIIRGEIPSAKVYEDDKTLAFLDITPVNPGHTLVVPKTHSENILDAADEDLEAVFKSVKKIAVAVKKSMGADGLNISSNHGPAAGQVIFHLHVHVMPRYQKDSYKLWHGKKYKDENEMNETAERIRRSL